MFDSKTTPDDSQHWLVSRFDSGQARKPMMNKVTDAHFYKQAWIRPLEYKRRIPLFHDRPINNGYIPDLIMMMIIK